MPRAPDDNEKPNAEQAGLYRKFNVYRRFDFAGKHDGCEYFVLDWKHDPFTLPALEAYAAACEAKFPDLARDLRTKIAAAKATP